MEIVIVAVIAALSGIAGHYLLTRGSRAVAATSTTSDQVIAALQEWKEIVKAQEVALARALTELDEARKNNAALLVELQESRRVLADAQRVLSETKLELAECRHEREVRNGAPQ